MLSINANILLYAYSEAAPEHDRALAFITAQSREEALSMR
jgi:predicted nucleic acid-binding protein